MKRSTALSLIILFLLVQSYAVDAGEPLTWRGDVVVLGKINAGYTFTLTNLTYEDNGSVYTAVLWLKIERCVNLNLSCPTTERISFVVKKDTNTFILDGKPAFFAFYWAGYTLSRTFYNLGNELKPSRTEIYLHNSSEENRIGWGVDLEGRPRVIEKCTAFSIPQTSGKFLNQSPKCARAEPRNFTTDIIFKGPYPVTGEIYYSSDPFGIAENHSVLINFDVVDSPHARSFLRSVKDVPGNSPLKLYLVGLATAVLLGLLFWGRRR